MYVPRPSGLQRAIAMLASQLVASALLLGLLLAFDPALLAWLVPPALA